MRQEFRRLRCGEWSALHAQTGLRRGRQSLPVARFRITEIAFGGNVQANRLDDFRRKMIRQPVCAGVS